MGLRDWIWPFNGTEETEPADTPEEFDQEVAGTRRDDSTAQNHSQAAGMDSARLDGVMDPGDRPQHSQGRTVLGTDESAGLEDEKREPPGEHKDVAGHDDEKDADSGKSVEEFLSGNLGEDPVDTRETPETGTEEDETKQETEQEDPVDEEESASTGEAREGQQEEESSFSADTIRSSTPEHGGRHGETDDTFMELPDVCVMEQESPDPDASAEEMLPEVLPGWDFQKTDRYRWQMDNAEDYINATYRDPQKRRYMFHVSKWKPSHVTYALDELYGFREPHPFDVWAARGQFIFAVKIAGGTVDNAHTLLMACPALSKSYFQIDDEEDGY